MKPEYLYHGSPCKADVLLPHAANGLPEENGTECGVYSYEKPEDVLPFTLSIQPYRNGTKSVHVDDATGVTTIAAGILDDSRPGYMYKVPSNSFEKLDDRQWLSRVPVIPTEVTVVQAADYLDKVKFTGSAEEIRRISKSIACCGLVCALCHLAGQCGGCRSKSSCCGARQSAEGCYPYTCCGEKGFEGCWQCARSPCDRGMFYASHDIRLQAFILYIKQNGRDRLAERLYFNERKGVCYGLGKDYDGLGSIEAVIRKLEGEE